MLATLVDAGTAVEALCFTRGEASTLDRAHDLGKVRQAELDIAVLAWAVRHPVAATLNDELGTEGFEVAEAADGAEALDRLRALEPDQTGPRDGTGAGHGPMAG